MISVKSLWLAGLLVFGACAANAQQYWSTNSALNCGAYGADSNGTPYQLPAGSGPGTGGYVCFIDGTLPWYASGAGWGSSIRVTAPSSAPVAYFLTFSDTTGASAALDFTYSGDATVYNGNTASQALYANQPLVVDVLGLHSQAPNYGTSANGSVFVEVQCPDANTCAQVQAQLIYSALPSQPWSLSAPVIWDWQTSFAWSVIGVDDSKTNTDKSTKNVVSFVIYNLDLPTQVPQKYTINVYDVDGKLDAQTTTGAVPANGVYSAVLKDLLPDLPSGPFKLQIVGTGATAWSAFEALQFHGPSATTLVASPESAPTTTAATTNSVVRKSRRTSPAALHLAPLHTAIQ